MPGTKQTAQQAVLLLVMGAAAERGGSCALARILFTVVHLLLELLGLLLVDEAQPGETVLQLECVEEGPVLVVGPRVEYLLVPDDATIGRLECSCQWPKCRG